LQPFYNVADAHAPVGSIDGVMAIDDDDGALGAFLDASAKNIRRLGDRPV
jgi:hypothetical protein